MKVNLLFFILVFQILVITCFTYRIGYGTNKKYAAREWKSSKGVYLETGCFIVSKNKFIYIEKENGDIGALEIKLLSKKDKAFVFYY